MFIYRKYGTATTIDGIPLVEYTSPNFAVNPTLEAGDVKISKDGGAFANVTDLPAVTPTSDTSVRITLTATEMQAARICVRFIDQTSEKEWKDQEIVIETYGHASAQIPVDWSDSVRMGLTALPNASAAASGGLPILGTNAAAISFTSGMTISNASGSALTLSSSGSNGSGLNASGNGSGAGITATGGATGNGINAVGGSSSGNGIRAFGTAGNGNGLAAFGQGSGSGILATGGATGHGVSGVGGSTSGNGIRAAGSAGNSAGLAALGNGSAAGLLATGGATGAGISAVGGSTSGDGFVITVTSGVKFNADILDGVEIESGINARQAISLMAAALVGELTGADGETVEISAADAGETVRITATVDEHGNRSAVTLNPPE